MAVFRAGEKEKQFANIVWDLVPVKTSELVRVAEREFGWARSTMYTVLRRLIDKGIFTNERGTVTANITRKEFEAGQSEDFVNYAFDGSLPLFLRAYSNRGHKFSEEEIESMQRLLFEQMQERKKQKNQTEKNDD